MSRRLLTHVALLLGTLGTLGLLVSLGTVGAQAAESVSHAPIKGSGSSWAANAIAQWQADVATNGGMHVDFNPNGAALGRSDFAHNLTDFGVSDIGYQGVDPSTGQQDSSLGRGYAYLPIAAGGTALPYHLEVGGQMVRALRLSGETVAKIFTNQITNWNDPAITKDNNGHALPSIPVVPVVHSEGAGVTYQFTRYLAKQYPSIWAACNGGKAIATEYFPTNCGGSGAMKSFSGSDGVMNFLTSAGANGAIAMEEYSYPLAKGYPSAKLLNTAGYYTLPTQYNVAVALTKAQINMDPSSPDYLTQNLDQVYTNADKRTYPLSSYVYAIIPTSSKDSKTNTTPARQTVGDFLYYSICAGQSEIGPIGYSSLPVNLVQAGFAQLAKLKTADHGVVLTDRNVSTCHNPTFIAGQPNQNYLAKIAPQPAACDHLGAGPCTGAEGTSNANPVGGKAPAAGGTTDAGSSSGTAGGAGAGAAAGSGGITAAPGSGAVAGAGAATSGAGADLGLAGAGSVTGATDANGAGVVVPTTLAADEHAGPSRPLTGLVVLLFVLALVVPPVVGRLVRGVR
ncbi:MAG: substrate-binding domain-containing protein [Nocardioides sp.]